MARTTREADVMVIGGGVSGLAAARELARAGLRVTLLEARPRLGGRILTERPAGWKQPVELGAEFVHGGNPELWSLLRSARVKVRKLPNFHWLSREGRLSAMPDLDRRIGRVTRLISPARAGQQSFGAYFRRYPPPVSADDWMLARNFVEGFEAAPMDRISARSLAGESLDEQHQYSVPGGYDRVVDALAADCRRHHVEMLTDTVVRSINWRRGSVEVTARGPAGTAGRKFTARAAIITLPVGVLQARAGRGAVRFDPPLQRQQAWIDRLQMGQVVRLVIRLRAKAWRNWAGRLVPPSRTRGGLGFIHSSVRGVQVWWALSDRPVLVGWAGGPAARALLKLSPAIRRKRALRSLAEILRVKPATVDQAVVDWQAWDWAKDPFARGAYSFSVAGEDGTAEKLRAPVQGTLYFAGEALAEGAEIGTVHGALGSGIRAGRMAARVLGIKRLPA